MKSEERKIVLKLSGPTAEDGKVSLSVLASKLDALQKAFYNVASGVLEGPLGRRGRWSSHVMSTCELLFSYSAYGSPLELVSEIAEPQPALLGETQAEKARNAFRDVMLGINQEDPERVAAVLRDSSARLRAAKAIQLLCPGVEDDYVVEIGNGAGNWATLTRKTQMFLKYESFIDQPEDSTSVQTVTGKLDLISVRAGRKEVGVRTKDKYIRCDYPPEMEDSISQMVAGSIVEVTGRPLLEPSGALKRIDEVHSIEPVRLSPFRLSQFSYQGRTFILRHPVTCVPDFRNGLWVYECEALGLHSYDESREQALNDLHAEFALIFDEYAIEDDSALAPSGLRLKEVLNQLVKEVIQNEAV
ncbi:hypothetical protein J7M28_04130 [bacterium]|nr:hypothetical protein [bacterium]